MEAVESVLKNIHAAAKPRKTAFVLQDGEIPFGVRRQGEMIALRELIREMAVQTAAEVIRFVKTDAHRVQRRLHHGTPLFGCDFHVAYPEIFRNGDLIGWGGGASIRRHWLVAAGIDFNHFQLSVLWKGKRHFRSVEFDFGRLFDDMDDWRHRLDNGVFHRFHQMDEAAADDADNQQHQQEEMAAAATTWSFAFGRFLRLILLKEIRRVGGLVAWRLMCGAWRRRRGFRWFRNMDGRLGLRRVFVRKCRHGNWFRKTRADLRQSDSHDLQP